MRRFVVLAMLVLALAPVVAAEVPSAQKPKRTVPTPRVDGRSASTKPVTLNVTPAYAVTYQYDSLGRLITATKDAHVSSFDYDAAGNRTSSTEQ